MSPRTAVPRGLALVVLLAVAAPAAADVAVHGLLDLAAVDRGPGLSLNRNTFGDSPFDAFGLHLFADGAVGEKVTVTAELFFSDAMGKAETQVTGAYVRYRPFATMDLNLMAGKVPWPIGAFGSRALSSENPLVGRPLLYQHHTSLSWYSVPPSADALIAVAGRGQSGVSYTGGGGFPGMPVVDESYWDAGVVASGSRGPFELALGIENGAPGWASTAEDDNGGKSVLGRLGFSPMPALRVGVSGSHGPYLHDHANASLPAGTSVSALPQDLGMVDLEIDHGHGELHAEGYHNQWKTATVGNLQVTGFFVEGRQSLRANLYAAGRYEQMRFSNLANSSGVAVPWDRDVDRLEAGLGFRPQRGVVLKAVYQRQWERGDALHATEPYDLIGGQLSVSF